MRTYFLLPLLLIGFLSNVQNKISKITITKSEHLSWLPSASGVEYLDGKIYIIGDDTPYLYELNGNFSLIEKYKLSKNDSTVNNRVPKAIKADFESMAVYKDGEDTFFMVLSSGSKETTRDTIHLFSISKQENAASKNIRPLFENIRKAAKMSPTDEINIEALAIGKQKVYMLQRGNNDLNLVIVFGLNEFMQYITKSSYKAPQPEIFSFKLPEMKNTIAGFSGACLLPGESGLLFTASLEATSNAYDDGEILGSYIGQIKFTDFGESNLNADLVTQNGKVIKTKLEGISIKSENNQSINILCVSDNDDGTSRVFEIEYLK